MSAAATQTPVIELELQPNTHKQRILYVRADQSEMTAVLYGPKREMFAYAGGALSTVYLEFYGHLREYTLWIGRAAFDVTENEALQLQQAFALQMREP